MSALYLSDRAKLIRLAQSDSATTFTWQSAATTDITLASWDTRGYDEFWIIVSCGSIASGGVPRIKAVGGSTDNSTFADIAGSSGTALTATDDYKNFSYNYKKVFDSKRYYNVVVERPTGNTTIDAVHVLLLKSGGGAVTQDTTMGYRETVTGAIAGTA
jgi:hypothetical protein